MSSLKDKFGWIGVSLLTCAVILLMTVLAGGIVFFLYFGRPSGGVAETSTLATIPVSAATDLPTLALPNLPTPSATVTRFAITPASVPPTVRVIPSPAPTTAQPLVSVDDPGQARTIDGQQHILPAHSATWYRFGYGADPNTGKRPVMTITLVNGKDSGVRFEVYAPENLNAWWNNQPTGRGTVQMVDCTTGEPSETGECKSPDLVWKGAFGAGGTYYVRVVNDNNSQSFYVLTIQ